MRTASYGVTSPNSPPILLKRKARLGGCGVCGGVGGVVGVGSMLLMSSLSIGHTDAIGS